MLKLTPILLAIAYGLVMYHFSAWRTRRELDARSARLTDPRLTRAFGRLAGALDLDDLPVHLYEIEPVNGLAAPDGRIFITRGLYSQFQRGAITAAELTSVVAHELGHVALGHARRRMIDFSGQNALRVVLATVLGRLVPGIGVWIANIVASLLGAGLSRADEFEADAYAAALMSKAGLGTDAQTRLLSKLDSMTGTAGRPPVWLASHPGTEQRIAAIEALARRWSESPA